jgi:ribonuclease P/MRP protein subunit POP7
MDAQQGLTARTYLDTRIQKRPLLRPPIPSPHATRAGAGASATATTPQVVYIQRATPFMSAVRRVRALLRGIDARAGQSARDRTRPRAKKAGALASAGDGILAAARAAAAAAAGGEGGREAVVVRGSGRAIDKVLHLAAWFAARAAEEGVAVGLATGSVCAIDDVVVLEPSDTPSSDPAAGDDAGPLPESRVRQVSVLEAKISRR